MGKRTKEEYVKHLNTLGQSLNKNSFIINGVMRLLYYPNSYGFAIRKYDHNAFEEGYKIWKSQK